MECIQKNMDGCNCSYEPCPRKGKCCECVRYHRKSCELPGCFFHDDYEKGWDRSVQNFIRMVREKGMRID